MSPLSKPANKIPFPPLLPFSLATTPGQTLITCLIDSIQLFINTLISIFISRRVTPLLKRKRTEVRVNGNFCLFSVDGWWEEGPFRVLKGRGGRFFQGLNCFS